MGPFVEEFTLRGTVANATNGDPLVGAVVEVTNGRFAGRRGVTDADGSYEIPDLVGAMTVRASKQSFRPQSSTITLQPCRNCNAVVRLDFRLQPARQQ